MRLMTKIAHTDSDSVFRRRAKSFVHFVILLIITTHVSVHNSDFLIAIPDV